MKFEIFKSVYDRNYDVYNSVNDGLPSFVIVVMLDLG
jgi:hypothetical protein